MQLIIRDLEEPLSCLALGWIKGSESVWERL